MPSARSLADDLRERGDAGLVRLLLDRPDLARPAPVDLTTLAARATTRASVQRVLDGLDLAHLQALEAIVVGAPLAVGDVARLLGEPRASRRVAELVQRLCDLALCWRGPEGIRPPRTVQEVVGDPAGLGPRTDDAPEGRVLNGLLARLDPAERALLEALAWGPPTGVLPSGSGDTAVADAGRRLLDQHLLRRLDSDRVLLPRQVALALRGGRLHRKPELHAPGPAGPVLDQEVVDATAGSQAAELLGLVADLLDEWAAAAPRVLRSGGLAVRDLARAASRLEIDGSEAAFLVELMHAAGLVGTDDGGAPVWAPTTEADDWAEQPAELRWAGLALAWLASPAAPSLVGGSDGVTRVNALSTQSQWPAGRQRRRDVLAALRRLPEGAAPGHEDLVRLLRWTHPVRYARDAEAGVAPARREAEWLGLTGRGALSTAGRRAGLTGDPETLAALVVDHLPPAVKQVLVQADLTAVAPGRLDGPARGLLRLLARLESRGGATVHRFTEDGVRSALDLGWSADRVVAEIAAISATGVPQPLQYLVRDVARRHGVARVGVAGSYVRSDDVALLDRMHADRSLALLQLTRLAPTVAVSPVPVGTLLDVLREHRYGPLPEGPEGTVTLSPRPRRARPRSGRPIATTTLDAAQSALLVAAMRRGERARPPRGTGDLPPRTDPVEAAALLREAAAERLPVWIGYADDAGGVQRYLLHPTAVEAGRVRGTVADQDAPRTFLLHRISAAGPAH